MIAFQWREKKRGHAGPGSRSCAGCSHLCAVAHQSTPAKGRRRFGMPAGGRKKTRSAGFLLITFSSVLALHLGRKLLSRRRPVLCVSTVASTGFRHERGSCVLAACHLELSHHKVGRKAVLVLGGSRLGTNVFLLLSSLVGSSYPVILLPLNPDWPLACQLEATIPLHLLAGWPLLQQLLLQA